jgi:hypothetical protein
MNIELKVPSTFKRSPKGLSFECPNAVDISLSGITHSYMCNSRKSVGGLSKKIITQQLLGF